MGRKQVGRTAGRCLHRPKPVASLIRMDHSPGAGLTAGCDSDAGLSPCKYCLVVPRHSLRRGKGMVNAPVNPCCVKTPLPYFAHCCLRAAGPCAGGRVLLGQLRVCRAQRPAQGTQLLPQASAEYCVL